MTIRKTLMVGALAAVLASASMAAAEIRITEWMYSGAGGEFVEFTNVGLEPVALTGWSYDDDSQLIGEFDLSGFGLVQPGESVVLTENIAAAFRVIWSLPESVKVVGEYTNNLGRADEINLFDADGNLADRLTYGDAVFPGTIRTQNASGNPLSNAALGTNDVTQWTLASVGDVYGSYAAAGGDVGNPGLYTLYIPEPASLVLLGLGLLALRCR